MTSVGSVIEGILHARMHELAAPGGIGHFVGGHFQ